MEGERVPLILKNKGNCIFCQSPTQSGDNSLKPLLHSLQVKQVSKEVKVEEGSGPAHAEVDLQGFEIKTGLCTECENLNLTFYDLKQKMKACLAKIKGKVTVGREKDDGGMKYPSLEGAIMKETLSRLNRKEPRVILQDLPLSERSIPPWELPEVKVEVDDQDDEHMSGDVEVVEGVGGNMEDPSSSPITSEFDDPTEGSSSSQSQNGKRKRGNVSNAPDCSMHAQSEAESKRPRTANAPVSVEPSTSKRSFAASPPAKNVNQRENSDGDSVSVASAEPSTSIRETAEEEVNGVEEITVGAFNSTFEQDSLHARLSALEVNMKELELKMNKATLERDAFKESLQQISEEIQKRKAATELEKKASVVGKPNRIQETVEVGSAATTLSTFHKAFPLLASHLDLKDVLKCRLVCKDWKSAISSFLEDWQVIQLPFDTSSPSYDVLFNINKAYSFGTNKRYYRDPNNFLEFYSPTRNPFITNSMSVAYDKREDFQNGIDAILETFGRHIYHFKWLGFASSGSCSQVIPGHLRKLFVNSLELKTLVVRCMQVELEFPENRVEDPYSLPKLETLVVKTNVRSPIANWLFKNFHLQIKTLVLDEYGSLVAASKFPWPQVTQLGFKFDYMEIKETTTTDFLKCMEAFPNLNKLCLDLDTFCVRELQQIRRTVIAERLMTICPRFHALRLLVTEYLSIYNLDNLDAIRLAPKELDTLEISFTDGSCIYPDRCDFVFLVQFPHIKKLNIFVPKFFLQSYNDKNRMPNDKTETVEIHKYLKATSDKITPSINAYKNWACPLPIYTTYSNPLLSNIWKMLKNLETLRIQNYIYKRPKISV